MSKYAAINTLDHRLSMMGFSHPDSTKTNEYQNANGDTLALVQQYGTKRWCWHTGTVLRGDSFSKRSIVSTMETSGMYLYHGGTK